MPEVKVKELVYDYPNVRAVDNVSFDIQTSSITALVGPNGAGKTTLMRCLAGLEKPFTGEILVDGMDVIMEPRRCHQIVGFLPDFFGLYEGLTVRQSLAFFAAAGGVNKETIPFAVKESAKRLWIADRLDTHVKSLSRGMRQRLAIAQIVIKKPKLLLLDEPASGLDPGARNQLSALFRQLKSEGMTLIVSSHILTELEQYADRLVIMNNGRVLPDCDLMESDVQHTKVSIALLSGLQSYQSFAESNDLVIDSHIEGEKIILKIAGGSRECAEFLKQTIHKGFEVCEYTWIGKDMQSEYMRVVALCKGDMHD